MKLKKINFIFILIILFISRLDTKTLLMDNFNTGEKKNKFGGGTGGFAGGGALCKDRFIYDPTILFGKRGYSLKLKYDVTAVNSYCGYYSKLNFIDLSDYNYLSFWVRGDVGGEFFKIEIKNSSGDANRKVAKSYINDYLDGGVTTQWQKVVIPLDTFGALDGWTNMNEFVIVFENYQSSVNNSPLYGNIYIDNIVFGSWSPGYVRFDHFGDNVGINGFGGNMGDYDGGNGSASHYMTNINLFTGGFPLTMVSRYNIVTAFVGNSFIFGGGTTGWIEIPHNLSAY
ncbi:MAG: hypothetical protein JW827_10595, partial [Spirochaetes bacterium]|nr:hypothetical protein [Spirochaetota bacterium]